MENIFILSSRPQLLDSLRRSLVYANTMELSFKFYDHLDYMLADISLTYMPKLILVDPIGLPYNLPSSLQPIAFCLVEHLGQFEREVLVYQSIKGFVDDVCALCGSSIDRRMQMVDGPRFIWLLDLEEKSERSHLLECISRSARRKGMKIMILDYSKWGDALKSDDMNPYQNLSELLDLYSRGQLGAYRSSHEHAERVIGMDHPMDSAYLTRDFLEAYWLSSVNPNCPIFVYSGLLENSAMFYMCDCSQQVWFFENIRGNQQRLQKEDKLVNWLQNSNKKIKIEKIKADGAEQQRIEALMNSGW